ncbi:hypothetical protein YQE_04772, partial [Dendroctonus ponderosae]
MLKIVINILLKLYLSSFQPRLADSNVALIIYRHRQKNPMQIVDVDVETGHLLIAHLTIPATRLITIAAPVAAVQTIPATIAAALDDNFCRHLEDELVSLESL